MFNLISLQSPSSSHVELVRSIFVCQVDNNICRENEYPSGECLISQDVSKTSSNFSLGKPLPCTFLQPAAELYTSSFELPKHPTFAASIKFKINRICSEVSTEKGETSLSLRILSKITFNNTHSNSQIYSSVALKM